SNTRELVRLETEYQFQNERDSLNRVNMLNAIALDKERLENKVKASVITFIGIVLIIVMFFLVFFYKSQRREKNLNWTLSKQRDELQTQKEELHQTNEELQQIQQETLAQRDYIEEQHNMLSIQKKKMESSIRAALLIQQAALPSKEKMKSLIPEYFLIYKPLNIVSGDFYWVEKNGEYTYLVVADCTGHGVEGAFMSLIGISLLNEAVKINHNLSLTEVLESVHTSLNNALRQEGKQQLASGMELGLLCWKHTLQHQTINVHFASAGIPLYVYHQGAEELVKYKGSRKSIGGKQRKKRNYEQHTLSIDNGDVLYIGSDGYVDQHNAKRNRLGSTHLESLLKKIAKEPLNRQKESLESSLSNHKEDMPQRDDITYLGIKF
ncbi:MAG: SpoIIE family protein phosphatase, partial [Bacteroidota bacterium]